MVQAAPFPLLWPVIWRWATICWTLPRPPNDTWNQRCERRRSWARELGRYCETPTSNFAEAGWFAVAAVRPAVAAAVVVFVAAASSISADSAAAADRTGGSAHWAAGFR